jgi:hypothetical protein
LASEGSRYLGSEENKALKIKEGKSLRNEED